jgi:hypothetical protein
MQADPGFAALTARRPSTMFVHLLARWVSDLRDANREEKNDANSNQWKLCLNPRHCVQTSDLAFETPLAHRVFHRIVHRIGE